MNRKSLRKVVDSLGLQLMSFENGTGNGANIRLKAPDGYEQRFMVNRLDDTNSDKINIVQFRKFARDHAGSHDLPGMQELDDLALNNMQRALMAAHEKVPDNAVRIVSKLLEGQPLLNVEGVIKGAMLSPEDPVHGWLPQSVRLEEQPPPTTVEEIDAIISQHPTEKIIVPATKRTLTKPTLQAVAPDAPAKKPRKTIDRIGQVEFFKLCTVLTNMDMTGLSSLPKLADRLTVAFGTNVAPSTAKDALEATGKKLDKIVEATDAQVIIAKTLTALLIKLSEPVPAELRALCGEIA